MGVRKIFRGPAEMAICKRCGEEFTPKTPKVKLCYPCWTLRENAFERIGELEAQLEKRRLEIEKLWKERAQLLDIVAERVSGLEAELARAKLQLNAERIDISLMRIDLEAAQKKASQAIPSDLYRLLLSLCHPDRHNSSPMSTKAMAWLLSLRGER